MPQWSRSRRSGVTPTGFAQPGKCSAGLNGAAPEGAGSRLLHAGPAGGRADASMEPLPKERGHGNKIHRSAIAKIASMEPLPKERGHKINQEQAQTVKEPQWSRSRRSGVTGQEAADQCDGT